MQYRWERFLQIITFYKFFFIIGFFISSTSWAIVSIEPVAPYTTRDGIVYYAGHRTSTGTVDSTEGFKFFDLDRKHDADASRDHALFFDVSSTKTFGTLSGTQKVVVTITVNTASGERKIPISVAGGTACGSSNCQGQTLTNDENGVPYYVSARYTEKSILRIGIYPNEICRYTNDSGGAPSSGCGTSTNTGEPNDPSATSPTTFTLNFYIGVASSDTSVGPTDSAEDNSEITLSFHSEPITYQCPSEKRSSTYFPGDGEIYVNPEVFTLSSQSGQAPKMDLIVVARETSAGTINSDIAFSAADFPIVSRVKLSNEQVIKGFINSDAEGEGEDHPYEVAFVVRDVAGMVSPFSKNPEQCKLTNVRTSKILGFLKENNCFIATGAFRSLDSPPLFLFRKFRDEILLKFSLGKKLTEIYYKWSSQPAIWLVENPNWKYPVLRALLPIQIIIWFLFHPLIYILLMSASLLIPFYFLRL